ncbi:MAG: response regulator [Gemmatimonadaceae bacterium]
MTAPGAATHVLLVEDSALVIAALRMLLEQTGHRVSAAESVRAAVAAATRDRPDMILLDLSLPDGDGLAVLDGLRAAGVTPPPTVAVTGHDAADVRARCVAAGCIDVLTKPIPAMELPRRIAGWTDRGLRAAESGPRTPEHGLRLP